jgi:hypothetical protein
MTTPIGEERLLAWLDGELAGADAAEVEAAVRADPALAKQVAVQGALKAALTGAYHPVLDEPVPERLLAAAGAIATPAGPPGADLVDLADRRARRTPPAWAGAFRRSALPIAAGLALGFVIAAAGGLDLGRGPLVEPEDGGLIAGRPLDRALDSQLASAQPADAAVRVGLTFRTAEGGWCRTFNARADEDALSGVACREEDAWRVRLVMAAPPMGSADGYRMAASPTPEPVLALVDQLAAGSPVDAAGEAAAVRSGWR